ncbi:hypothetical protein BDN72DRAFT_77938 [Pluteus cervinus]|uniref:Uncharacterized protein n=1 Tax=Pluteus cervinus TaxID=181527 RepID=A0ACD3B8Q9_9AGAR|nr:hypothetical protein BDN72DRAFT_77938 [Pluteus cervinus]
MNYKETDYPEPEQFVLERFIHEGGNLIDDDRVLAYGFGKSICPRRRFASSSVRVFVACFVATFGVTRQRTRGEMGLWSLSLAADLRATHCHLDAQSFLVQRKRNDQSNRWSTINDFFGGWGTQLSKRRRSNRRSQRLPSVFDCNSGL